MFRCIVAFLVTFIAMSINAEDRGRLSFTLSDLQQAQARRSKVVVSDSTTQTIVNRLELQNVYIKYKDDQAQELDYYTFVIYNNSYAGAYGFDLYVIWKDSGQQCSVK